MHPGPLPGRESRRTRIPFQNPDAMAPLRGWRRLHRKSATGIGKSCQLFYRIRSPIESSSVVFWQHLFRVDSPAFYLPSGRPSSLPRPAWGRLETDGRQPAGNYANCKPARREPFRSPLVVGKFHRNAARAASPPAMKMSRSGRAGALPWTNLETASPDGPPAFDVSTLNVANNNNCHYFYNSTQSSSKHLGRVVRDKAFPLLKPFGDLKNEYCQTKYAAPCP